MDTKKSPSDVTATTSLTCDVTQNYGSTQQTAPAPVHRPHTHHTPPSDPLTTTQTDQQSGNEQPQEEARACEVDVRSEEGREVVQQFNWGESLLEASGGRLKACLGPYIRHRKVTRIFRLHNPALREAYDRRRRLMSAERGGGSVGEVRLFHGTKTGNVDSICVRGFSFDRCGAHGATYGRGIYFTQDMAMASTFVNACDEVLDAPRIVQTSLLLQDNNASSRDTRSSRASARAGQGDPSNTQRDAEDPFRGIQSRPIPCRHYMFLCDVLTGVSIRGERGYTCPPPLPTTTSTTNITSNTTTPTSTTTTSTTTTTTTGQVVRRYDSCYNMNWRRYGEYVVFRSDQAYPQYVVEFTHNHWRSVLDSLGVFLVILIPSLLLLGVFAIVNALMGLL